MLQFIYIYKKACRREKYGKYEIFFSDQSHLNKYSAAISRHPNDSLIKAALFPLFFSHSSVHTTPNSYHDAYGGGTRRRGGSNNHRTLTEHQKSTHSTGFRRTIPDIGDNAHGEQNK